MAGLVVAALLLPIDPAPWAWHRGELLAEPWRWLSGAFVHWTPRHAAANTAGALILAWVGWRAGLPARAAWAWAAALPLAQTGLVLKADLLQVAGLSGLLHAGVAVLVLELLCAPGRDRWIGAAVGVGLLVKLGLEQPWGPALRHEAVWGGMPVVPWAHAAGAAAGVVAWALLRWLRPPSGSASIAAPSAGP
jgi:rhomboid family GlyGly-CTERM serine protease